MLIMGPVAVVVEVSGFSTDDDEVGNFRRKQDEVLLAASFEPVEGDLWIKEGVHYGREAALQYALKEQRPGGGVDFDASPEAP